MFSSSNNRKRDKPHPFSKPNHPKSNPGGKHSEATVGNFVIVPGCCINWLIRRGKAVYCHINDRSILQPLRSILESDAGISSWLLLAKASSTWKHWNAPGLTDTHPLKVNQHFSYHLMFPFQNLTIFIISKALLTLILSHVKEERESSSLIENNPV